jgi:hypothetical protein
MRFNLLKHFRCLLITPFAAVFQPADALPASILGSGIRAQAVLEPVRSRPRGDGYLTLFKNSN